MGLCWLVHEHKHKEIFFNFNKVTLTAHSLQRDVTRVESSGHFAESVLKFRKFRYHYCNIELDLCSSGLKMIAYFQKSPYDWSNITGAICEIGLHNLQKDCISHTFKL